MRKQFLSVAVATGMAVFSGIASADIIGAEVHAGYWGQDVAGDFGVGSDVVNLENNLNLDGDDGHFVSVSVEHPVPLLPNVKVGYTNIKQSGNGTVGSFDGITGSTDSELDLTFVDLTAYYEVLDNIIDLDLGLTVRSLDSELTVSGGGMESVTEVKGALPMVYGAAAVNLPFTGVSAGAEANLVSYGGDSIVDGSAYVQYSISLLEVRGGYRMLDIDYEDDNAVLKMKNSGPFLSVGLDF